MFDSIFGSADDALPDHEIAFEDLLDLEDDTIAKTKQLIRKITTYIRNHKKIVKEHEMQEEVDQLEQEERGKKRKRKRAEEKVVDTMTQEEIEMIVSELIHKMNDACEQDIENNRNKRIAYHKLDMLNEIFLKLSKPEWREKYIQHGVLSVIRKWLEPLPDRTIPNIKIRMAMLRILESVSDRVYLTPIDY